MYLYLEICQDYGIDIAGIVDGDYFGNTETYCGLPVIDTELAFDDPEKLKYYKENFNFFCATTWTPMPDPITVRNREKRLRMIDLIDQLELPCISLVGKKAHVSSYAKIGKSCFVADLSYIEPRVVLDDYVNIYGMSYIGHSASIGRNSLVQRKCVITCDICVEDNVYIAAMVSAFKEKTRISTGTFVHECVYINRGTIKNEIVSLEGENMRRVKAIHDLYSVSNCQT